MLGYSKDVDFNITYKDKTFHITKVDATYNNFYLITELDKENTTTFISIINEKALNQVKYGNEKEHLYKEDYKGMSGIVPVDAWTPNFGRFRLDMWMPDENKDKYNIN